MAQKQKNNTLSSAPSGVVYFIGAGPGDPKLLTLKGRDLIQKADVIMYAGSLVNPQVLAYSRREAEIYDSSALTLEEITGIMVKAARKGKTIGRLHTGDPAVYGAIAEQMDFLRNAGVRYIVIPGVTSAFAAAATLKKEFTVPGLSQSLIITRRGGKTSVPARESLSSLATHQASMAIFLSTGMLAETVKELIDGGYPADTPVAVVYRASWKDEVVIRGNLATIVSKVTAAGIRRQAIILVGDAIGDRPGGRSRLYTKEFSHGFRPATGKRLAGPALIAVTRDGVVLGKKIINAIRTAQLFLPEALKDHARGKRMSIYKKLDEAVERLFRTYNKIVFIMAAGIAVRMIAPYVRSKWSDPAVVVMDDRGKNIISLLSGHWGGANQLAKELSELLGGHCVLTTSSDVQGSPALDLIIRQLGSTEFSKTLLTRVQASLVNGKQIGFYPAAVQMLHGMADRENLYFYASLQTLMESNCNARLVFSHEKPVRIAKNGQCLFIHPRDIAVGIGCNKGTSAQEIRAGIASVFKKLHLPVSSIHSLCTFAAKKNEPGLRAYANAAALPIQFFTREALNRVAVPSGVSYHAQRVLGVQGVAEPAALLGSHGGALLMHKVKLSNITLAVGQIPFDELIRITRSDDTQ